MIGTIELLAPYELKRVVAVIINEALRIKLLGIRRRRISFVEMPRYLRMARRSSRNGRKFRSWGVIPFLRDLALDQEDSVSCDRRRQVPFGADRVNIAVVLLPRMSNFTDFNQLAEEDVALRYAAHPEILPQPMPLCFQGPRTHSRICAILGRRVSQKQFVIMLLGG